MNIFSLFTKKKSNRIDNSRFYHAAISDHGFTPKGLRWHSLYSQEIRFEQLLSFVPDDALSIVDAGCGFGDLCVYARKQKHRTFAYTGLDMLEVMVDEAHRRTGETILLCDILRDPLPSAEFYLCSGALNILTKEASFAFIEQCYRASTRGFIFNFLEGDKASPIYNYLSKTDVENLGVRLNAKIVFRNDYYESDCTAAFYK